MHEHHCHLEQVRSNWLSDFKTHGEHIGAGHSLRGGLAPGSVSVGEDVDDLVAQFGRDHVVAAPRGCDEVVTELLLVASLHHRLRRQRLKPEASLRSKLKEYNFSKALYNSSNLLQLKFRLPGSLLCSTLSEEQNARTTRLLAAQKHLTTCMYAVAHDRTSNSACFWTSSARIRFRMNSASFATRTMWSRVACDSNLNNKGRNVGIFATFHCVHLLSRRAYPCAVFSEAINIIHEKGRLAMSTSEFTTCRFVTRLGLFRVRTFLR